MPPAPAKLIPLPFRISDVLFSCIYLFFFLNAAFFFLSECRVPTEKAAKKNVKPDATTSAVPSLLPVLAPLCDKASSFKLALAFELDAAWDKDIYPAREDRTLKLIGSIMSLVLCLPLAVVMIFGTRNNQWQSYAILHATTALVCGIHALNQGLGAHPKDKEVFEAAYIFMVAAPLALLHRWWGENIFTYSKTYSGLSGVLSFFTRVACFFGLIYVATCVFDWAIVSHKELHGITKTRPIINKYSAAATEQLYTFWKVIGEKLEVLGKVVVAKIQEFQK